jgi:hypothetical protein
MAPPRSPEMTAILAKSSPEFVAEYERNEARFAESSRRLVRVSSLTDAFPVGDGWKLRNWFAGTVTVATFPNADTAAQAYRDRTAGPFTKEGDR